MQQMIFLQILLLAQHVSGHHYAHHQELESIIQVVLPVVFGALVFKLSVWCGGEGCVSGLRAVAQHSRAPDDGHNGARNMLSKQ